jgi:glutamyl-tRNA synthetase
MQVSRTVRTRIAPSPTGFLHLGTARTALFSWAFTRHHGGQFVLRIEDTDVARNTQESVDQIIAAMQWLGLQYDEGPFYQMQRLVRYREVIRSMIAAGTAYFCYSTPEELDTMRERQRAAGENIRYDGTWRTEPGKKLPPVPAGVKPVVRFKNPLAGTVGWTDLVKGAISFDNRDLDDLIIARPSDDESEPIGIPTYNFCVVVDDWDMHITHVFRGDEHVNNTPRQINIFNALGAPLPQFGHVPIILGDDGLKLSKRRGAVSVMEYAEQGYLPEAMVNYLARLGWSHGDDELFSRDQLVQWFNGTHLAQSPAQWDGKKLDWVNAHYLKACDAARLASLTRDRLAVLGIDTEDGPDVSAVAQLLKERANTVRELADLARMFYVEPAPDSAQMQEHITASSTPAVALLRSKLEALTTWDKASISAAIKAAVSESGLKMPQVAMPVRLLVVGRTQTPSVDAVLELLGRDVVLQRLGKLGA